MERKYLFFDWDGTLIGASRTLNPGNIAAIREAQSRGHRVFLCSGRSPRYLQEQLTGILEPDGYVGCAGGVVCVEGQKLFENGIAVSLLEEIEARLAAQEIYCNLETAEHVFYREKTAEYMKKFFMAVIPGADSFPEKIEQEIRGGSNRPAAEYTSDMPVQKLTFVAADKTRFPVVRPWLEQGFFLNMFGEAAGMTAGEMIPRDCTKQQGIQKVLDYYGADWKDTVGFGDSMNDAQMLAACGTAVVWEGALPQLRALADLYFEDPDREGLKKALKQLKLIGE